MPISPRTRLSDNLGSGSIQPTSLPSFGIATHFPSMTTAQPAVQAAARNNIHPREYNIISPL
ncbi:hypothetical protein BGZ60DRAFT_402810 [Tricladium varicosporioides]|nr:hypothetical protein BGZ60DRAFT_402810 [Hymenoscyphus varicosporioides]